MAPVNSAGIPTVNAMLDGRELPVQDALQDVILFKDLQQNRATAKMTKID